MGTDPRTGYGPRWTMIALLAASLATAAAVAVAVPSPAGTTAATGAAAVPATVVPALPPGTVATDDGAPVPRRATGALFDGPAGDPGDHFCSGSVVGSAGGDLVVTAARCVADGDGTPARTGMSFAPGYDDDTAPFGYWTVTAAAVPPGWLQSGDPGSDVAFLTVSRAGAPPIEQLTGAYRLAFTSSDDGDDTPVTAVGYNDDDSAATTVSGTAGTLGDGQWELERPGLDQGASGGPWLTGPDDSEILTVTGGYQHPPTSPTAPTSARPPGRRTGRPAGPDEPGRRLVGPPPGPPVPRRDPGRGAPRSRRPPGRPRARRVGHPAAGPAAVRDVPRGPPRRRRAR
ncbi:serine protease [Pseudonocardia sp. ICBG1293]|uniref:trypsin-like serine peptidase n=1 Tax=Pseudonocardia sp. ICBG1293 TaxID=2844382 RepID=UPI001CC95151|nr:hypothetical protein [Pseudonocardia sp. ICBG1293]